jgi:hypothetical protein
MVLYIEMLKQALCLASGGERVTGMVLNIEMLKQALCLASGGMVLNIEMLT